ncbi:hypothetical protein BDN71DRAFT_1499846 [Pleurotus eryngii]|uniref:Uncharacterized protein n=1 Tax=Pleurotus eryngii TaxID=5323 RepID=A0A9P6D8H3_PLEER|nr:hypothetical protein BDN71DRAFT_1499846 [Pleurotus eryngii]
MGCLAACTWLRVTVGLSCDLKISPITLNFLRPRIMLRAWVDIQRGEGGAMVSEGEDGWYGGRGRVLGSGEGLANEGDSGAKGGSDSVPRAYNNLDPSKVKVVNVDSDGHGRWQTKKRGLRRERGKCRLQQNEFPVWRTQRHPHGWFPSARYITCGRAAIVGTMEGIKVDSCVLSSRMDSIRETEGQCELTSFMRLWTGRRTFADGSRLRESRGAGKDVHQLSWGHKRGNGSFNACNIRIV